MNDSRRELLFKYVAEKRDGTVCSAVFSICEIEKGYAKEWIETNHINFLNLRRLQFIGRHDNSKQPLFEEDTIAIYSGGEPAIDLKGKIEWNEATLDWVLKTQDGTCVSLGSLFNFETTIKLMRAG